MPRTKTATLNLRIEPAIKDAAERAARDSRRSLTGLIEWLLMQHLTEKGYLKENSDGSDSRE